RSRARFRRRRGTAAPIVTTCFESSSRARNGSRACTRSGINRDLLLRVGLPLVLHDAIHERKQGEVPAGATVLARVNRRADLAHEDVARANRSAVEDLDAPALRVGIAPIA